MRPPRRPPRPAALPALCAFASACNPEPKGGFSPEFECGELDYFEVVALMEHHRTYEIACGQPLQGDYYDELTWRELAVTLERHSEEARWGCIGPERNPSWISLREGCAIEAAVNAQIHGLQTVGCPPMRERGGWPDDTFYAATSYIDLELAAWMHAECNPDVSERSVQRAGAPPPTAKGAIQRGGRPEPTAPFTCGEIDAYDLAAIMGGGPFEERCSDVAEGTWREVAAYLRENAPLDTTEPALLDPSFECTLASCANLLFESAARSTCGDVSPYLDGRGDGACADVWRATR
jgi:hypothetical protein